MSLGAVPTSTGCRFRVWAPEARRVAVVGEFNQWLEPGTALQPRPDGYWEGTVPDARPGQAYKYLFTAPDDTKVYRIDPAARDTRHSGLDHLDRPDANAAIIRDASFDWVDFQTPDFANFIIYQLHIGTFTGHNDGLPTGGRVAGIANVETKLQYIRDLGFNAIELLPIQEFRMDRSWGYNPSFFFAPESAYGTPDEFRRFVDRAHARGLAVIFDVVFNHVSMDDNPFWSYPVSSPDQRGAFLSGFETPWGLAPDFWRPQIKEYFLENIRMYFEEYRADGLRFDATRYIEQNRGWGNDGWEFMQHLTYLTRERFPDKYLIAEHLPEHESVINGAGFCATWFTRAHHDFQRAASGQDSLVRLKGLIGSDFGPGHRYPRSWNLVKYLLGSHDDCGDDKGGSTENQNDWEHHRYFNEFFGGRDNWHARAKARLGWALNAAMPGTPMLFMGNECHHPGYWHDALDGNGEHRFDWHRAGDHHGLPMRRLVRDANLVRWSNPALRSESLQFTHEDHANGVLAFKRWTPDGSNVVLAVVNVGDQDFAGFDYGVATGGQNGQWTQVLCSQDDRYGGWHGAGNAFHEPWTQGDGKIYVNLPQWGVTLFRLK